MRKSGETSDQLSYTLFEQIVVNLCVFPNKLKHVTDQSILIIIHKCFFFRNDVIPVVMGARKEDYQAVAPPYSFIHVEDFPSAKELANYLHMLDKNQTLYEEYFSWKNSGHFIDTKFWCRLCSFLHSSDKPMLWYPNIDKWWRGNDTCTIDKWSRKQDYITDWRRFG